MASARCRGGVHVEVFSHSQASCGADDEGLTRHGTGACHLRSHRDFGRHRTPGHLQRETARATCVGGIDDGSHAMSSSLGVEIRPYTLEDAPAVWEAAWESCTELQPWMPWC